MDWSVRRSMMSRSARGSEIRVTGSGLCAMQFAKLCHGRRTRGKISRFHDGIVCFQSGPWLRNFRSVKFKNVVPFFEFT